MDAHTFSTHTHTHRQNKRILEHRFEVAILAERLVARKKDAQIVAARTSTPEVVDGTNTQM